MVRFHSHGVVLYLVFFPQKRVLYTHYAHSPSFPTIVKDISRPRTLLSFSFRIGRNQTEVFGLWCFCITSAQTSESVVEAVQIQLTGLLVYFDTA